jgi:hypothetical protein
MTGLPAALVVVAGGIAALLLIGSGIWFWISCVGRLLTARADLRTSQGKHLGLSPASTTAVSPSRWQGSGKLAPPGQARWTRP